MGVSDAVSAGSVPGAVLTWSFDVTCSMLAWTFSSPGFLVCLLIVTGSAMAAVMALLFDWQERRETRRERDRRTREMLDVLDPVDVAEIRRQFALVMHWWCLGGDPADEGSAECATPAEDDPEGAR